MGVIKNLLLQTRIRTKPIRTRRNHRVRAREGELLAPGAGASAAVGAVMQLEVHCQRRLARPLSIRELLVR